MKIDINLTGQATTPADFGSLKAALVAAQAATPTVRALRDAAGEPPAAPTFADLLADGEAAAALAHRFFADGERP